MDFRQWLFSLSEYVSGQSFFCRNCFRTKTNVRQIFSNSLQLFMLNDIDMFSYGDGLDNFIDLCKKTSLYFDKDHNHKNDRSSFNQRRRGRTMRISENDLSQLNLTPMPPLVSLNNSFNFQEDELNENYEHMRDNHILLSEDENIVVNLNDNADAIVYHTLMDIIDKIVIS